MSITWRGVPDPPLATPDAAGRLRIARRGLGLLVVIGAALLVFWPVRLAERLARGPARPWSPVVVRRGFRATLRVLGLGWEARGAPLDGLGAQVANHQSWLDIFVLASASRVTFVSKAEVRGWPAMGWLAAIAGTVFISRRRAESASQQALLRGRLLAGDTLAFFPEGTSTDGRRVLAFRSTLFAAVADLPGARVQPVTLRYDPPPGERADFYGWWGGMTLPPHLAQVLAVPRQGRAVVTFHPPIPAEGRDRKAIARAAEAAVRSGLEEAPSAP